MRLRISRPSRVTVGVGVSTLILAGAGLGAYFGVSGSGSAQPRPVRSGGALPQHPAAGSFKPDGTKLAGCRDQRCYEQAFGNLTYYEGPKNSIPEFDRMQLSNKAVEAGCHRIAHVIGSAALARYKGDVSHAFAEGSSTCWSGYYHGILERALTKARNKADYAKISRDVCEGTLVRATQWLAYQCVHGLGHGLMIQSGYNLPFALSICEHLRTGWDATSCDGGVFMENVNGALTTGYGFKSPWLRDDDLVYPCGIVKERHKLYCYLMVTSRILQANGYDWKATAKLCTKVEQGWRETCFQSFGRDASGSTRGDAKRIVSLCALGGRYEGECIFGASRDLTANDTGGARAAVMCRTARTALRPRCFYGIGTILASFGPAGGPAACRPLTAVPALRRECERGANGL